MNKTTVASKRKEKNYTEKPLSFNETMQTVEKIKATWCPPSETNYNNDLSTTTAINATEKGMTEEQTGWIKKSRLDALKQKPVPVYNPKLEEPEVVWYPPSPAKNNDNPLLTAAIDALEQFNFMTEEEIEGLMVEHIPQFKKLLHLMASLTTTSCGNINKVYEKTAAMTLQERNTNNNNKVVHVKNSYGPDIKIVKIKEEEGEEDTADQCIDVKTSTVKAVGQYKSDWCISLNTTEKALLRSYTNTLNEVGTTKEVQKKMFRLLAEELDKKVANGYMLFLACCGEEMINEYELDGRFVVLYTIQKLVASACSTINLGSVRCDTCYEYHRMRDLDEWAQKLVTRLSQNPKLDPHDLDCFDPAEWKLILNARIQSQCPRHKADVKK